MKAALTYAAAYRDVKFHELALDEFCALAGTGKLSGEATRVLLWENQRVIGCVEIGDTEAPGGSDTACKISPMFSYVAASETNVAFEFFEFVLREDLLNMTLALTPSRK